MTDLDAAADGFFAALQTLRKAAGDPSYTTLVRQAAAQQPPITISPQRLSDRLGGTAVPADPAVVRFLVEYLQHRAVRAGGYQSRPLRWWLKLHQQAKSQRQAGPNGRRRPADTSLATRETGQLGRPISECDPLVLEVHPAIQIPDTDTDTMDPLPPYVPRDHDIQLREIADQVIAAGSSRLVTLVSDSSTGKTR